MIHEDGEWRAGVSLARSQAHPDGGIPLTPLHVDKISPILIVAFDVISNPVYHRQRG